MFWLFALLSDLQNLFEMTDMVYNQGLSQTFGFALAKFLIPLILIYSPYILVLSLEYIVGIKFFSDDFWKYYDDDLGKVILGLFITGAIPWSILVAVFVDIPKDFGFLHTICYTHFFVSLIPLIAEATVDAEKKEIQKKINDCFHGYSNYSSDSNFDLILIEEGARRVDVIRLIRTSHGSDFCAAMKLVDNKPSPILTNIKPKVAIDAAKKFLFIGAKIEIKLKIE